MKLLFYRYGSICEPDIIQTFIESGFEVYEFSKEITNKDYSPSDAIADVSKEIQNHPVDFVFTINFFPFLSEVCNIFHIRYLSWIVDAPVMELYSTSIANKWNRVFLFDSALYDEISPFNPENIFYLPLAANVSNKEKLFANLTNETRETFSHNISFVGSLYTEKCPYDKLTGASDYLNGYLTAIMKAQEHVYGYYFIEDLLTDAIVEEFKEHLPGFYEYPAESYLTDKRTMSQLYIGNKITALERIDTMTKLCAHYPVDIYTGSDTSFISNINNHGFAKSLTEMPVIFHESKINLNTTSKPIRNGLPLRIFDIISCGGFVLTNYQADINGLFTPGSDLVVYTSLDEMVDLCDYYLNHASQSAEIAITGLETLKKYHTYEQRISEMLQKAFGL